MTTKDFYTDASRQRRLTRAALIVVVLGLVASVIALLVIERKNRRDAIAETTAAAGVAALAGPPCQVVTAEAFAPQAAKARKVFEFNGDTYARRFGHLDCNLTAVKGVRDPVPVCQFTGPQALSVTTAKGSYYFLPGPGQPATIRVVDEVATCVMASNFR